MKVQDFAYHVSVETMDLLGKLHHYNIPENIRKEVTQEIQKNLDDILKRASK